MSYQVLQYNVQFTYSQKSLDELRTALDNQVFKVKIKFDSEDLKQQLDALNKSIIEQSVAFTELVKNSNVYNRTLQQNARATKDNKEATYTAGQQLDLFAEQQRRLNEEKLKQDRINKIIAASEGQMGSGLADKYDGQTQSLLALRAQMERYIEEAREIKLSKEEGEELTEREKERLEALKLAVNQLNKAYKDEKNAIVERNNASGESSKLTEENTQKVQEGFQKQISSMALLSNQMTAVKSEMSELERIKKSEGELTTDQAKRYEALKSTLTTLQGEYKNSSKSIQDNQNAQKLLGETTSQQSELITQKYAKQVSALNNLKSEQTALKNEVEALQKIQKSSTGLTDEQTTRLETLKFALDKTNKAYNDQRNALLNQTSTMEGSAASVDQSTQKLNQSYSSQLQLLAQTADKIQVTKEQMSELDRVKQRSGTLTDEERTQYQALQTTLATLTRSYNETKTSILQNEQAQQNLTNSATDTTNALSQQYISQVEPLKELAQKKSELRSEIKALEDAQKSSSGITEEQKSRLESLRVALDATNKEYNKKKQSIQQDNEVSARSAQIAEFATTEIVAGYQRQIADLRTLSEEKRSLQEVIGSLQKKQSDGIVLSAEEEKTLESSKTALDAVSKKYNETKSAINNNIEAQKLLGQVNMTTNQSSVNAFGSLSEELAKLSTKKQELTSEIKKLENAQKQSGGITEEQKQRLESLRVALQSVKKSYNEKQRAVEQSSTATTVNAKAADDASKAIIAGYAAEVVEMKGVKETIDAINGRLQELNTQKKINGKLTAQQQVEEQGLRTALAQSTSQYNALKGSIVSNEQAQTQLSQATNAANNTMISSYTHYGNSLAQLAEKQKSLRDEIKALENAQRQSGGLTDDQRERLATLKLALQEVSIEYRKQSKEAVDSAIASNTAAHTVSKEADDLSSRYKTQTRTLQVLSEQKRLLNDEIGKIEKSYAQSGTITDEQSQKLEQLRLKLNEVEKSYNNERNAILERDQLNVTSMTLSDDKTQKITNNYTAEMQSLMSLKEQMTDMKRQLQDLDMIRQSEGELSDAQKQRYEALQTTLQGVQQQYNQQRNAIQATEQSQRVANQTNKKAGDEAVESFGRYSGVLSTLMAKQRELKTEIQSLQEIQKTDAGLTDEQAQRLASLQMGYKKISRDIAQYNRDAVSVVNGNQVLGNSYEAIEAKMKQLAVRIKGIQDPMGQGKKEVERLTAEYNRLNDQLKKTDASMGNHQRNVGSYVDSLRQFASGIAIVQGPLGPLSGRINSLATFLKKLNEANIAATLSTMTLGKIIQRTLITTGLGALLVVLGSVINYLKGTEEGNDRLAVSMAKTSAIVVTIGDQFRKLGKFIVDTFTNNSPKELLQKLVDVAGNVFGIGNLFDKLKGFIVGAFEDPQQAVVNLWEVIKRNIMNRVEGVIDTFKFMGKTISSALDLDWDGVKENGVNALDALMKVTTGLDEPMLTLQTAATNVGDALLQAFESGTTYAKDLYDTISDNVELAEEEQHQLNELRRTYRELGIERAKQNKDIQEARRYVRENRYALQEGVEMLNKVIENERKLAKAELEAIDREFEILAAQEARNDSDSEAKDEIAKREEELYNRRKEIETNLMKLIRDRTTLETKIINLNYKQQKDLLAFKLNSMAKENTALLYAKRGLLRQLEVAEKEYNEVFGNESLKRIMQTQYEIEETARFMSAGFEEEVAAKMAAKNAQLRIDQEQLESEKKLADIRRKYNETLFDSIKDASFRSAEAIFGESKLISSAETIIDTVKGAQRAFAANPNPIGVAQAAAIVAKGAIALKKINSTKPGDKSISGTGASTASAKPPKEAFGIVDRSSLDLPSEIAAQLANSGITVASPNITLSGEFDPEVLSIKVQQGNNVRSGQGVGI